MPSGRRAFHEAAWIVLLAAAWLSAMRGSLGEVLAIGQVNWFAGYSHGFMRRGLAGAVFQALFGARTASGYQTVIILQHWAAVALLVLLLVVGLRFAARRADAPVAIMLGAAVVVTGQALPTLMWDVGYLDAQILILVALAVWAAAARLPRLAGLIAAAGVFAHEQVVFYWAPLAAAQLILRLGVDKARAGRVALEAAMLLGPMLAATGLVLALHSPEAARLAVAATPVSEEVRHTILTQTFQMSVGQNLSYMALLWRKFSGNGLLGLLVFAGPAVLTSVLGAWAFRRSGRLWVILAAMLVGSCGCLAILAVAWDLSRFASLAPLLWAGVCVLVAARTSDESDQKVGAGPVRYGVYAFATLVIAIGALSPLTYTYFNQVLILHGRYQLTPDTPLAPAMRRWFNDVWATGPV